MRQSVMEAMDIVGGAGICKGQASALLLAATSAPPPCASPLPARVLTRVAAAARAADNARHMQANFMSQAYLGIPIAITVEGANALTRSLISFGQVRGGLPMFCLLPGGESVGVGSGGEINGS